jgi:hypothetical protein
MKKQVLLDHYRQIKIVGCIMGSETGWMTENEIAEATNPSPLLKEANEDTLEQLAVLESMGVVTSDLSGGSGKEWRRRYYLADCIQVFARLSAEKRS